LRLRGGVCARGAAERCVRRRRAAACARAALLRVARGDGVLPSLLARPGGARGALTGEPSLSAEAICARLGRWILRARLQKAN